MSGLRLLTYERIAYDAPLVVLKDIGIFVNLLDAVLGFFKL